MRRLALGAALTVAVAAPAALAATIDRTEFRYTRALTGAAGAPLIVEPDGPFFAHARPAFEDLRILDARDRQVPWRPFPERPVSPTERVTVLNVGREGGQVVALLDLGGERRVRDRVELEIPDVDFVGRVVVRGSDRRSGPFRRLSATGIYDIGGAMHARSTAVVFPPSDFRYLELRATGISTIAGAAVSGRAERPRLLLRRHRGVDVSQRGRRTVVSLDLGFRKIPVDELRIDAQTPRYERPVEIAGSNDGRGFEPLASARIFRFAGSSAAPIALAGRHRFLRITIENGDDEPLEGIRVAARARSRAILVEGGHRPPYRVFYGSRREPAPSYDFARLPRTALDLERARPGALGAERRNEVFERPADTRSFFARHDWLVQGALALTALVLGLGGFLALRRRT